MIFPIGSMWDGGIMPKNSNIIELKPKLSSVKKDLKTASAPIVDMTERRNEMIQQERRRVKRTILSEFLSACIVIPQQGLCNVSLYDISETGIAFDLDRKMGSIPAGEEVAVRVYMSGETYFPFIVTVKHGKITESETAIRYGATFIKNTVNDEALFHFVKFLETISASLKTDHGDVMVSNLR